MKKIVSLFIACIVVISAVAQTNPSSNRTSRRDEKKAAKRDRINALLRQEEEGEMIFHKHSIFGIKLATDGYGLTYEHGKFKTPRKAFLMQFELSEKKHPKERKQAASYLENVLWESIQSEKSQGKKKLFFRTFENIALTSSSLDTLYRIWKNQAPPAGVKLS